MHLCDPMDYSPPGSFVHGIRQAKILELIAIPFSRGSSRPRDRTQVSCIMGRFFTICITREAPFTFMPHGKAKRLKKKKKKRPECRRDAYQSIRGGPGASDSRVSRSSSWPQLMRPREGEGSPSPPVGDSGQCQSLSYHWPTGKSLNLAPAQSGKPFLLCWGIWRGEDSTLPRCRPQASFRKP